MSTSPRQALYARLVEILGDEHALTLFRYLPESEPATRDDVREVGARIDGLEHRSERIEQRMNGLEQRMDRVERQIEALGTKLEDRFQAMMLAMAGQAKTYTVATVSAIVAASTLVAVIVSVATA